MFKKASIFLIIIFSHFAFAGVSGTPNPNANTEEYVFNYQISAKNDYTLVKHDSYPGDPAPFFWKRKKYASTEVLMLGQAIFCIFHNLKHLLLFS